MSKIHDKTSGHATAQVSFHLLLIGSADLQSQESYKEGNWRRGPIWGKPKKGDLDTWRFAQAVFHAGIDARWSSVICIISRTDRNNRRTRTRERGQLIVDSDDKRIYQARFLRKEEVVNKWMGDSSNNVETESPRAMETASAEVAASKNDDNMKTTRRNHIGSMSIA